MLLNDFITIRICIVLKCSKMPTEPYWNVEFKNMVRGQLNVLVATSMHTNLNWRYKMHMGPTIILSPITTLIPMLLLLVLLSRARIMERENILSRCQFFSLFRYFKLCRKKESKKWRKKAHTNRSNNKFNVWYTLFWLLLVSIRAVLVMFILDFFY